MPRGKTERKKAIGGPTPFGVKREKISGSVQGQSASIEKKPEADGRGVCRGPGRNLGPVNNHTDKICQTKAKNTTKKVTSLLKN